MVLSYHGSHGTIVPWYHGTMGKVRCMHLQSRNAWSLLPNQPCRDGSALSFPRALRGIVYFVFQWVWGVCHRILRSRERFFTSAAKVTYMWMTVCMQEARKVLRMRLESRNAWSLLPNQPCRDGSALFLPLALRGIVYFVFQWVWGVCHRFLRSRERFFTSAAKVTHMRMTVCMHEARKVRRMRL